MTEAHAAVESTLAVPPAADTPPGVVGRVPVRNIWLLMLYASDLFQTIGAGRVGLEQDAESLPDLIAEILAFAVGQRLRRQLTHGTYSRAATLTRMRGRVDLLRTERRQLLSRGAIACRFEDFSTNTARNRLVRAALESIARIVADAKLAHQCRVLANTMRAAGVIGSRPSRAELAVDRFTRNDAQDRVMVDAAKLALDFALPSETAGDQSLFLPERQEQWVRRLFERAVGGFYRVTLSSPSWTIQTGRHMNWPLSAQTAGIVGVLPRMKSDIQLDNVASGRRIIIDTKFTSIFTAGWYRDESLKSGYLYQLYSYLRSQCGQGDTLADHADGLLLHPTVGESVDEMVMLQGHRIRFATIDLTASATAFRSRLLELIDFDAVKFA